MVNIADTTTASWIALDPDCTFWWSIAQAATWPSSSRNQSEKRESSMATRLFIIVCALLGGRRKSRLFGASPTRCRERFASAIEGRKMAKRCYTGIRVMIGWPSFFLLISNQSETWSRRTFFWTLIWTWRSATSAWRDCSTMTLALLKRLLEPRTTCMQPRAWRHGL